MDWTSIILTTAVLGGWSIYRWRTYTPFMWANTMLMGGAIWAVIYMLAGIGWWMLIPAWISWQIFHLWMERWYPKEKLYRPGHYGVPPQVK